MWEALHLYPTGNWIVEMLELPLSNKTIEKIKRNKIKKNKIFPLNLKKEKKNPNDVTFDLF